jgi:hypothetical protein
VTRREQELVAVGVIVGVAVSSVDLAGVAVFALAFWWWLR